MIAVRLAPAVVLFAGFAIAALVASEGRAPRVFAVMKPLATLALLVVVGLPPAGRFDGLVIAGIVASVGGDLALLAQSAGPLVVGIGFFVLAHGAYAAAFWTSGAAGPWLSAAPLGLLVMGAATVWLLRRLWPSLDERLRAPVLLYATIVTAMVGSAFFVLRGPWPERVGVAAAAGAVLFYVSDAMLAWRLFHAPGRGRQAVSLTFYWSGQLGLAVAAHFARALS
jgi:uncharacterized membrane protein YhhN